MIGFRSSSKDFLGPSMLRLFTTFENKKGTRFKKGDYYFNLQKMIDTKRIHITRQSPLYEGHTEHWATLGRITTKEERQTERMSWLVYYVADDLTTNSPEGYPLVIRCMFFGIAPIFISENAVDKNDCKMQWNIDTSMSIEIGFSSLILDNWRLMYQGLQEFLTNIRME